MMKRMATRTTTIITDDLDGTELHPGQGETLTFALDGRTHEIDLTDEHAAALRAVLHPTRRPVDGSCRPAHVDVAGRPLGRTTVRAVAVSLRRGGWAAAPL